MDQWIGSAYPSSAMGFGARDLEKDLQSLIFLAASQRYKNCLLKTERQRDDDLVNDTAGRAPICAVAAYLAGPSPRPSPRSDWRSNRGQTTFAPAFCDNNRRASQPRSAGGDAQIGRNSRNDDATHCGGARGGALSRSMWSRSGLCLDRLAAVQESRMSDI